MLPRSRQGRLIAAGAAADSIANGLFLASATLYFVQYLSLSAVAVGSAIASANVVGLLSPALFGPLADRVGARRVYVGLTLVRAAGFGAYAFVGDYAGYLVVSCVVTGALRAGQPLLQVIVGEFETDEERTRTMGSLRAIGNTGLTVGFLLAAVVQAADARAGFVGLFAFNALVFLAVARAVVAAGRAAEAAGGDPGRGTGPAAPPEPSGLPESSDVPEPAGPPERAEPSEPAASGPGGRADRGGSPFRDRRFLVVCGANAVLHLHDCVLFILLPLWTVQRAGLPESVSSALLAVNTVLTVVFQLTVARHARGAARSLRILRLACVFLVLACLVFAGAGASAGVRGPGAVVAAAVVAVVLLTTGENLHAVARWELSYEMSPARARGRYLSVFSMGQSAQLVFGPFLVTAFLLPGGTPGWLLLAALFLAATVTICGAARPFAVPEETAGREVEPVEPRR
ncbi:MFS transporter [Streptomyces sp. WAC06614]|uniref:MFS transporter n=1 Tax=Streptomyces sp. WAC06614 TaxID=2487416 RepID=UPI00163B7FD1|nr:MFS transporter [Streptomyces sp. WAC06614]